MNKLKSLLLTLAMVMGLAGLSFGQQVFISVDNHITATGQYCFGQTSCNVGATAATYWILTWTVTGTVSACTVATDSSADRVTWSAGGIVGLTQTCTTTGNIQVGPLSTVNFIRNNVLTFTGSGSVSLTLKGYASNPSGGGGGGGVASVSASSPIASSGGVSPNISLTGLVPIANGGTGTATPGLIQGTNITITGSWPNQTINSTGGGGGSGNMTAVGTPSIR